MIFEEFFYEVNVINLNDVFDLFVFVVCQNNFGGFWNVFFVCGFVGDINFFSGFFVNGFNVGCGFGGFCDIVGIEFVEVFKGLCFVFYGCGEFGGMVNFIIKCFCFFIGGYFCGMIGSWDQYCFEGDYQVMGGQNEEFVFCFVGFYEDVESFCEIVEIQKFGFFLFVIWNIFDNINVIYEFEYLNQEIFFDCGVIFFEEFGFLLWDIFVGEFGDGFIEIEVVGYQFEVFYNFNGNWSFLVGVGFWLIFFEGNVLEINFVGWQIYFIDGQMIFCFFCFCDFDLDYIVFCVEFVGEFEMGLFCYCLFVGGDYDEFENDFFILCFCFGFFGVGIEFSDLDFVEYLIFDVFNLVYGLFLMFVLGLNMNCNEVFIGIGFYFQDQIDIIDKFQICIGGCFDDFEQDLMNLCVNLVIMVMMLDDCFLLQFGVFY